MSIENNETLDAYVEAPDTAEASAFVPLDEPQAQPLDSSSFLPAPIEEPQATSLLPIAAPAVGARIPLNVEEQGSQLALATNDGTETWQQTYTRQQPQLRSNGTGQLLSDVLGREFDEQITAARALAGSYAQVADARNTEMAARHALDAERMRITTTPENAPLTAQRASTTAALEQLTRIQHLYNNPQAYSNTLGHNADNVAVRNVFGNQARTPGGTPTWFEMAREWASYLLPGASLATDVSTNRALNRAIGREQTIGNNLNTYGTAEAVRNYYLGLSPSERVVMDALIRKELLKERSNSYTNENALRMLDSLTAGEAALGHVFNAADLVGMGGVFRAGARLMMRGRPLAAMVNTAGERTAGQVAHVDLVTGGKLTGLNQNELVSAAMSSGHNPLAADNIVGMAPHMQTEMAARQRQLVEGLASRLSSSGRTAEETAAGAKAIVEGYALPTNKHIVSVDYGEASVDGLTMVVRHGDAHGNAFLSREAGELYVAERGMTNAVVVPKSANNPTGEFFVRELRTDPYSYDSIAKYGKADADNISTTGISPVHGASRSAVESRTVGVWAEAATKRELGSYIKPYYKGVSRAERVRVERLLERGDAASDAGGAGREYSYAQARAEGLSSKGAQAYLATRALRHAMYYVRNAEMVRHLRAQGLSEIELLATGERHPGKVFADGTGHVGKQLWDMASKQMVKLDAAEMAAADAAGRKVVRFAQPTLIDGELRQLVFTSPATATARDIRTALHFRPGEFARIYTDEYFIDIKRMLKVDGAKQEVTSTIRTAASKREADAFVAAVKEAERIVANPASVVNPERRLQELLSRYYTVDEFKALMKGDFEGLTDISSHFTRNKDEYLNSSVSEALANGRLFTSKRSERLYSVDRDRANSLGVFESLEAEMTNVSRVANIAEWRENQIVRWMNTFGDLIPNRTGNDVTDFYKQATAKFTGSDEGLLAQRNHRYIMRQVGMRTAEENAVVEATRRVSEKMFKGGEAIESVGAAIRQFSPLGFIRNVVFHGILGVFNPSQLLVQANGAATAVILHPLHGAAAAKTFLPLRLALMSDNPAVHRILGKFNVGGDVEEFVSLVKAIRQTGLIDSMKSTALYNLESGKMNVFGSYAGRVSDQVSGYSTMFFNRGEEFSRVVSFDVARREWKAANPAGDWTSKEALAAILVRTDHFTQNMTKAAELMVAGASTTRGALSIPLQFAQYNIKLAGNMIAALRGRGAFTRTDAVTIMAAHLPLYGAAGYGAGSLVAELLPDGVKDNMSEMQKALLMQGVIASAVKAIGEWATGERVDVAIGSRLGAFNYYKQLATAMYDDDKGFVEVLLGPTGSTAARVGRAIGARWSFAGGGLWQVDEHLSTETVLKGLRDSAIESTTATRNLWKGYVALNIGAILDRRGEKIVGVTPTEAAFQALGFAPTEVADYYATVANIKTKREQLNSIADKILLLQKGELESEATGDDAYAASQRGVRQTLMLALTNAGDRDYVVRRIKTELFPFDTKMQKLLVDRFMKDMNYTQPLSSSQPPTHGGHPLAPKDSK